MINTLNSKLADIFIGELSDSGDEARVKKTVWAYRADPSHENEVKALAFLNGLAPNKITELRQAGRI